MYRQSDHRSGCGESRTARSRRPSIEMSVATKRLIASGPPFLMPARCCIKCGPLCVISSEKRTNCRLLGEWCLIIESIHLSAAWSVMMMCLNLGLMAQ